MHWVDRVEIILVILVVAGLVETPEARDLVRHERNQMT
jgi:hypothetical protein